MSDIYEGPWQPQPEGIAWVAANVERFRALHPAVSLFSQILREQTGTRLIDWIDHLIIRDVGEIEAAGYARAEDGWYEHPKALLPVVHQGNTERMLLRVDSVSDFAAANAHRFDIALTGVPLDPLRTAFVVDPAQTVEFGVIERRGCSVRRSPVPVADEERLKILEVGERLRHRRRRFESEQDAFASVFTLMEGAIRDVGRDMACHLFFESERDYWQSRNRAGRVQYMRQTAIGVGWGNHDHHTYRSSRVWFSHLIALLELLGFVCRERFYAGREAGWGAQVIEHRVCGVVIFADVDLSPEEISGDFSHTPLPPRQELGTIGLWCALHGEALFEAGLHHLECQFDYHGARAQLETMGVNSMKPFTDFPFLRQCFTEGERWKIDPLRLERILAAGLITQEQADHFAREGAIGSHLEILERNDGYRGFNQSGINDIIRRTDPRFLAVDH